MGWCYGWYPLNDLRGYLTRDYEDDYMASRSVTSRYIRRTPSHGWLWMVRDQQYKTRYEDTPPDGPAVVLYEIRYSGDSWGSCRSPMSPASTLWRSWMSGSKRSPLGECPFTGTYRAGETRLLGKRTIAQIEDDTLMDSLYRVREANRRRQTGNRARRT